MDDVPVDAGLYAPEDLFASDIRGSPLATVAGQDFNLSPEGVPQPPSGSGDLFGSIGNALGAVGGDVLKAIPGVAAIETLIGIVVAIVGDVESAVKDVQSRHPLRHIEEVLKHTPDPSQLFRYDAGKFWYWITVNGIRDVFKSVLEDGLHVDTSKLSADEQAGVNTIDAMLGWAVKMTFITTALSVAGKGLFANRWTDSITESLSRIPEAMGLNWALGMTMSNVFMGAQGASLQEGINEQKRPNRIEWPQIRMLLKQHKIDNGTYTDLLKKAGFPDDNIAWLSKLSDQQIPVGDIGQLYYRGELSSGDALDRIKKLGFDDEDAGLLHTLYVTKAENEASVTYRTIARQLFTNHLIGEDQYRAILTSANFPEKLIDQDIAGIKLEHEAGKLINAVGTIKERYQHKHIDGGEARHELRELNYADDFVTDLLQSWDDAPVRKNHSLSQAKILSYYQSGVISRDEAQTRLQALGLAAADISLLLDHPSANAATRVHALTPGLVVQAYVDGAIDASNLEAAFKAAKVGPEAMSYYIAVARYRLAHKRGSGGNVPLTGAEYKEAFKYNLLDFQALVSAYEQLGYSPDNALLLAEIANKGPNRPPQGGAFATVTDALEYLIAQGYKVYWPANPEALAAEMMVEAAGYTVTGGPSPAPVQG